VELRFRCTECGKCCHDLRLSLSVAEAIRWLEDGNTVQVICEAVPWAGEPSSDDQAAMYWRNRSFAAMSGTMPARVSVILAASFDGACPNLDASMRCAIYDRRPRVCRIYPVEINPFVATRPERKACPPEAWGTGEAVLMRDGQVADAAISADRRQSRETDAVDAKAKGRLCALLDLHAAALTKEGYVIHSPRGGELLRALREVAADRDAEGPQTQWQFVSSLPQTLADIETVGAVGVLPPQPPDTPYRYVAIQG
jgi:Fe-S-cluster containining protein